MAWSLFLFDRFRSRLLLSNWECSVCCRLIPWGKGMGNQWTQSAHHQNFSPGEVPLHTPPPGRAEKPCASVAGQIQMTVGEIPVRESKHLETLIPNGAFLVYIHPFLCLIFSLCPFSTRKVPQAVNQNPQGHGWCLPHISYLPCCKVFLFPFKNNKKK